MTPMDMDQQSCLDRAQAALTLADFQTVLTNDEWNVHARNATLRASVDCIAIGNQTLVDLSVAGSADHFSETTDLRDSLVNYMRGEVEGPQPGRVCRDLRDGDPYYPEYRRCCDLGESSSRWTTAEGVEQDYGSSTCNDYGIY